MGIAIDFLALAAIALIHAAPLLVRVKKIGLEDPAWQARQADLSDAGQVGVERRAGSGTRWDQ